MSGIRQNGGANISGFSAAVPVDKGLTLKTTPSVILADFGDGYQQRLADGINTLRQEFSIAFASRPKAEIDNLVAFFEGLGAVSKFEFVVDDTTSAGNSEVYKVICKEWTQTWDYDDFYTLTANLERVYEA
tara:strand:- start:369 stop:761 length:393 start_codon:yes stop_codon:yes gene_type:complete